ncbi:type II toxin-antitoxin system RelE/ParE family toxin [Aquincola sp. MAHUQ-54]|uniref:Type II toxin-antitoxin system RelE/ParE family toxin n=1 Tax=Aquincola agrisoli TaxID=3119538 RepID=A0AAW9QB85_9BURK
MRTIVFTPDAHDDIDTAHHWYEQRRAGLGATFESAIEAALAQVQRAPERLPLTVEPFRRVAVRRFPHHIYYRFDAQRIVVLLVFRTAQDPAKALGRLSAH